MNTENELIDDKKKRFSDFIQKDYELKVAYLTNHFQRMWTRFNYFVLIEAALIGGKTIFGTDNISTGGSLFGLILSLLWYIMGAQDRYLIEAYRVQIKQAAELLTKHLWPTKEGLYHYVGHIDKLSEPIPVSITTWRSKRFSTTQLAAWIPLLVSVVWLTMLICKVMNFEICATLLK